MSTSRRSKNALLAMKAAELAFAAPQVVAHRMTRMASAGAPLSATDQKEFLLMGTEKAAAFYESWNAMALQAMHLNHSLASSFWRSMFTGNLPSVAATALTMHDAALAVIGQGLAPVHRRAVANAKRLGKPKFE